MGDKEDLGRRASSAVQGATLGMEWGGAVDTPRFPLRPLSPPPPSLPPLFLPSSIIRPSSPPEPLWLSGTCIRMLLLTEQHSTAGGPLGEAVRPASHLPPHHRLFPVWPGSTLYQEHPLRLKGIKYHLFCLLPGGCMARTLMGGGGEGGA